VSPGVSRGYGRTPDAEPPGAAPADGVAETEQSASVYKSAGTEN